MKTNVKFCNLRYALKMAESLGASKTLSTKDGIHKWTNGKQDILFVPDHVYTKSGTLTISVVK